MTGIIIIFFFLFLAFFVSSIGSKLEDEEREDEYRKISLKCKDFRLVKSNQFDRFKIEKQVDGKWCDYKVYYGYSKKEMIIIYIDLIENYLKQQKEEFTIV